MHKKRISLQIQSIVLIAVIAVPLMFMIIIFNIYTVQKANHRVYESGINTAKLYQNELERNLKSIENLMISLVASDPDYRQVQYVNDDYQKLENIYNIFSRYKDFMSTYSVIGVFNLRVKQNSINRWEFRGIYDYKFKMALNSELQQLLSSDTNPTQLGWVYREIEGRPLLFRVLGNGNIYTTCIIDPEKFNTPYSSASNLSSNGALLYSTNKLKPTHGFEPYEKNGVKLSDANDKMYITGSPQKYLISGVYSDYTKTHVFYMQPYGGVLGNLDAIQLALLVFSILVCCTLPFIVTWLIKSGYRPMAQLIETMRQIRTGSQNAKMSEDYHVEEYHQLSITFNELMQEIKELKIDGYEKEIKEQKARLMLLQSQIRPHFYLNSLKNFYALAQEQRLDDIQMFALELSNYLRYLFKEPSSMVTLGEEINSVENYINLQTLISSTPPQCSINVSKELCDILIPPLSILTFVENSIKHTNIHNEAVKIKIKAMLIESEDGSYLNFTVSDNGEGFSDEALGGLNSENPQIQAGHIGIINVKHRFDLVYKKKSSFVFLNNEEGACIEVFIPL